MPYEPLHHKYRPQTFKDLVGQETIAQTLSNALRQEKIAPAYLFTGPRGTGKTSSARILAKSLNCLNSDRPTPEPCGQCEACRAIAVGSALDVMEIDAASNTGVDNIREIIERSRFAPVQCRYKIYAIDECHMLSTAAFNALLKTLEEPPPRVVFILATTDPQRVLSTIISRCQRFDYRRIPLTEMTAHLRYIAERENIAIAPEALTLIAQIANGGLRDAESLLDQLSLLPETISVAKVWDLVGAVPEQDLLKLLRLINNNDSVGVLQQCRSLLDRGREPLVVLQNLAEFYLNLLIAKTAPQRSELTAVTQTCWEQLCTEAANWDVSIILRGQQQLKEAETQLKQTTQPRLWLEVTLLGLLPQINTAIAKRTQRVIAPTTVAVANPVVAANNLESSSDRQSSPSGKNAVSADSVELPKNTNNKPAKTELAERQISNTPSIAAVNRAVTSASTARTVNSTSPTSDIKRDNPRQDGLVAPEQPDLVNPQPNPNANKDIWSKVVDCLQPPTTQALLKQQCYLVSFDGTSATVGISSAKLQKLNQGKIPNIEAAFAKVCQRQVKVQLEVANSQIATSNNITPSTVVTTQPQPASIPVTKPATGEFETFSDALKPRSFQNPSAKVSLDPASASTSFSSKSDRSSTSELVNANQVIKSSPPDTKSLAVAEPTVVKPEASISEVPSKLVSEDEQQLQQAIDNLTHSFEGELVQLDNANNEFKINESSTPSLNFDLDRPNAEDYEDEW